MLASIGNKAQAKHHRPFIAGGYSNIDLELRATPQPTSVRNNVSRDTGTGKIRLPPQQNKTSDMNRLISFLLITDTDDHGWTLEDIRSQHDE